MGILNSTDKESIKVALPKKSNKIIDVAVARLYIAYPDPEKWQYTGLSGAIALVDDLVGNTFFLKLVDIEGHRGVIWDQELYVNFDYQQIRTFFHTFELENCYAGLLFEDLGEAAHFLKRIYKRERYASKKTLSNKNAIALTDRALKENDDDDIHGPRGETLYGSQRERYNYSSDSDSRSTVVKKAPPPPPPPVTAPLSQGDHSMDDWQSESSPPASAPRAKHPLPPVTIPSGPASGPPSAVSPSSVQSQVTQQPSTPRNPFPFPIPEVTSPTQITPFPKPQQQSAQSYSAFPNFGNNRPLPPVPGRNNRPVPPPPPRGNRVPPPVPPSRRGAPPPPPRRMTPSGGSVMQPNGGHGNRPAPPPPRRGPVPPPPPRSSRLTSFSQQQQQLPQQTAYSPPPVSFPQQAQSIPQPPPPGPRPSSSMPSISFNNGPAMGTPSPPLPPPLASRPQPAIPPTSFNSPSTDFGAGTPPPPPPPFMPASSSAPPPPPPPSMPAASATPPPPPPPSMPAMSAPSGSGGESTGDAGRDALLASIRGAGGIGSLRKVDKSQLDKPSALLQEARGEPVQPASAAPAGGGAPGGGGSLADALAAALNKRKNKVGTSDDYDNGDDW